MIDNVHADLVKRLDEAQPLPSKTGPLAIDSGKAMSVSVSIPFSERVWRLDRGEVTMLVAARIRYRDRVFNRERQFCQFGDPRAGNWVPCPFLND